MRQWGLHMCILGGTGVPQFRAWQSCAIVGLQGVEFMGEVADKLTALGVVAVGSERSGRRQVLMPDGCVRRLDAVELTELGRSGTEEVI